MDAQDALRDVNAERALIGSMIVEPGYYHELDTQPTDFSITPTRTVWSAIVALHSKGMVPDPVSIVGQLESTNDLEKAGGPAEITRMVSSWTGAHPSTWQSRIRDLAIRRDSIEYANKLATAALDQETPIEESRSEIAAEIAMVRTNKGAVHISEWMEEIAIQIDDWQDNPRNIIGLDTGIPGLNAVLGDGLLPGVNLVGGKPGLGKSILVQDVAEFLILNDKPGAYYSAEMNKRDMSLRLISYISKVPISKIRRGKLNQPEMSRVKLAMDKLSSTQFFVHDPTNMTSAQLRSDLVRLKAMHNIQWFVFDYLELLADEYRGLQDWQRAARLGRSMVGIANHLDIPALVVQKILKSSWGTDQAPDLGSFSGGADLGYDVTNAILMVEHIPQNPAEKSADMRTLINMKPQRNVESGVGQKACHLYKDPHLPRFYPEAYAKDRGLNVNKMRNDWLDERTDV